MARLEKPQTDGTTIAFSGQNDLETLQKVYKSVARKYNKIPIEINSLRVTTRRNGQMELLGKSQQL